MSARSNTKSKRSSSTKTKKSTKLTQKKPATTVKKTKTVAKSVKEKPVESTQLNNGVIEKTLANIEQIGNQTFASTPFNQHYDKWLNNLRQTVTEFETSSSVKIDKFFTKKCEQAFLSLQTKLTECSTQEVALAKAEKTLRKVNEDIKELDADYAKKKHELHNKYNTNTQKLIPQIKALENDIASQEKVKFGFFQFSAKKAAATKLEQTKQELKIAKDQLGPITQSFASEQKELQDKYVAEKQELTTKSDTLRREIEQNKVDASIKARKEVCGQLNKAINELVKRKNDKTSK